MDFWSRCKRRLWLLGLGAGVALLCAGAARGEFTVIWQKAVMVCLECVGIG